MIRTLHHMADALQTLYPSDVMAQDSLFLLEFANKRNLKSFFDGFSENRLGVRFQAG